MHPRFRGLGHRRRARREAHAGRRDAARRPRVLPRGLGCAGALRLRRGGERSGGAVRGRGGIGDRGDRVALERKLRDEPTLVHERSARRPSRDAAPLPRRQRRRGLPAAHAAERGRDRATPARRRRRPQRTRRHVRRALHHTRHARLEHTAARGGPADSPRRAALERGARWTCRARSGTPRPADRARVRLPRHGTRARSADKRPKQSDIVVAAGLGELGETARLLPRRTTRADRWRSCSRACTARRASFDSCSTPAPIPIGTTPMATTPTRHRCTRRCGAITSTSCSPSSSVARGSTCAIASTTAPPRLGGVRRASEIADYLRQRSDADAPATT